MNTLLNNFAGQHVKRGCLDDLNRNETELCYIEDESSCKLCYHDDCNKVDVARCYSCDSYDNEDCVQNLNVSSHQCKDYNDKCFTLVEYDQVIRGCLKEHPEVQNICSEQPSLCNTCDGDDCNSEVVREDIYCYDCDSVTDSNCRDALNDTMLTICPLSVNNVGCYHYDDG